MHKYTNNSLILGIVSFYFACISGLAQDSLKIDSSAYSVLPLATHGAIHSCNPSNTIKKADKLWQNYYNLSDLIKHKFPLLNMDLGQHGEHIHLPFFGALRKQNSVSYNGTELSFPYFQPFNYNLFSPDNYQTLQIFTGSDAVIFGNNSSGMMLNIQETIYNTRKPYTKLAYQQSNGDYISGDVTFAQNLSETMNFSAGVRSQSAKNSYRNNYFDYWNLRFSLRWNPDSLTSISLSNNYFQNKQERNGGVSPILSEDVFDFISNIPVLSEYQQEENINLLSLSATRQTDSDKLYANILFSNNNVYQSRDTSNPSYEANRFNYWFISANTGYSKTYGALRYDIGGDARLSQVKHNKYIENKNLASLFAFAKLSYFFTDNAFLSAGSRLALIDGTMYSNFGASLNLTSLLNSKLDLSYSETLLNHFIALPEKKESNILAYYSLSKEFDNLEIYANAFYRDSRNINLYSVDNEKDVLSAKPLVIGALSTYGLSLKIDFKLSDRFNIKLWNVSQMANNNGEDMDFLPKAYSGIDLSYRQEIGRSELMAGLSASFKLATDKSLAFLPLTQLNGNYINNFIISNASNPMSYDGVNAYIILRLGKAAFVRLSLNNLLNSKYYYISYYPIPARSLNLSVFWEFFD